MLKVTWKRVNDEMRKMDSKGYTIQYDARHVNGELMNAAMCYLLEDDVLWPWHDTKPKFSNENAVKAAALLLRESDRRQSRRSGRRTNG